MALTLLILLSVASLLLGLYPLPILFTAIIISIIAPFFDVPSMKKSGRLVYFSPFFLAEKERNGVIRIHGGTLLDYVFVIDRSLSARQRTTQIFISYIEGILNLLESYQGHDLNKIKVRGTSYIINDRTASMAGLRMVKTDIIQIILLIFNYPNLVVSHSLSKGRLSFPRIGNINTHEGTLGEVEKHRDSLVRLRTKLTSSRGLKNES